MSQSSHPSKKQLREFGILLGIVFPVVFGCLIPVFKSHHPPLWPFLIGVPSLSLALIAPRSLKLPYQAWMKLGHALGWLNSHLVLGMIFICVLQPIALLMRLFGYDPLRKKKADTNTYRINRPQANIDLKKIF